MSIVVAPAMVVVVPLELLFNVKAVKDEPAWKVADPPTMLTCRCPVPAPVKTALTLSSRTSEVAAPTVSAPA